MAPRPRLTPTQVTLTISDDPGFVPRYGHKVMKAGGRFTDLRGHKNRIVTLPSGNEGLVDAIAEDFSTGKVAIHVLRWSAAGFDQRLGEALNHPDHLDMTWDHPPGMTASQAVLAKGRTVSAAFDWDTHVARWQSQDASRTRVAAPAGPDPDPGSSSRDASASALDATMRDIAEEAVRILEGEADLDVLKALAGRYCRLRAAADAMA